MELDLGSIKPSVAGPKRPHDRVEVAKMKEDFTSCLSAPVGFKGFNIAADKLGTKSKFTYEEKEFEIQALKNEETRQMKAQITAAQEENRQKQNLIEQKDA